MTTRPFETVIEPSGGWFNWRLRQLWRYRELIALFVWRDFVAVYKQTILGPAWHILQPLSTTLVFTVVFGRIAQLSTDGIPPVLFYMLGTIAWAYFSNCLDNTSKTFITNASILGKVYFHRLVIPLAAVASCAIAFSIQLLLFLATLAFYRLSGADVHFTAWVAAAPLMLAILAGYGLAGGIIVCAMTSKYRDLRHAVAFGLQLMMYLTPVIYPLSSVPSSLTWVSRLNPLTPVFEGLRRAFLGVGVVDAQDLVLSGILMVGLVLVGLELFTRAERNFMDSV